MNAYIDFLLAAALTMLVIVMGALIVGIFWMVYHFNDEEDVPAGEYDTEAGQKCTKP